MTDLLQSLAESLLGSTSADFRPTEAVNVVERIPDTDLRAPGRPKLSIPGYGKVSLVAGIMIESSTPLYGDIVDDGIDVFTLSFELGGEVIAALAAVIVDVEADDLEYAPPARPLREWMSQFCTTSSSLNAAADRAWPLAQGRLPPLIGWVTSLTVAPAFQSIDLFRHMIDSLRWVVGNFAIGDTPAVMVITASAPTVDQAQCDPFGQWSAEPSLSLDWYRTILCEMGAVPGGQVNHQFMTSQNPQLCRHHPDLYLLPPR